MNNDINLNSETSMSASKPLIYALGKISYDFGTEACRDDFTKLMQATEKNSNSYNPQQLVDYLSKNPYESKTLTWTLNIDSTPIYAIEATDPFVDVLLIGALQGQILNQDDLNYVECVSIPGYLTEKTVRLYSGQVIPVISAHRRGLYCWNVNNSISRVVDDESPDSSNLETNLKTALRAFLNRIYYNYRNLGQTASERALNFAITNAFQIADVFAKHLINDANGQFYQLTNIAVEESSFCRMDSNCWDVKLGFFAPENDKHAMKIVRYTIDVSDVMPVTLGEVKTKCIKADDVGGA